MNIYLAGSSGTGKTTTAQILSKKLNMPVIDGIARSSPFEMGNKEHQVYISDQVFASTELDNYILCRTPLDVLAYSVAFGVGVLETKMNAFNFANTDPIIIYFPPLAQGIKDDGFRPTDIGLNDKVDWRISEQILKYGLRYYKVLQESPESRADNIIKYLEAENGKSQ